MIRGAHPKSLFRALVELADGDGRHASNAIIAVNFRQALPRLRH